MTNSNSVLFLAASIVTLLACKKDSRSNMVLYDKPQSIVKKYIAGKWEFEHAVTGYTQERHYYEKEKFIVFKFNDKDSMFLMSKDTVVNRSDIKWSVIPNYFAEGNIAVMNTSTMGFTAAGGFINDTLYLFTPATDGNIYYLTKAK